MQVIITNCTKASNESNDCHIRILLHLWLILKQLLIYSILLTTLSLSSSKKHFLKSLASDFRHKSIWCTQQKDNSITFIKTSFFLRFYFEFYENHYLLLNVAPAMYWHLLCQINLKIYLYTIILEEKNLEIVLYLFVLHLNIIALLFDHRKKVQYLIYWYLIFSRKH